MDQYNIYLIGKTHYYKATTCLHIDLWITSNPNQSFNKGFLKKFQKLILKFFWKQKVQYHVK